VTPEQYLQLLTSELIQSKRMPDAILYFMQTGELVEIDENDPKVAMLIEELESKGLELEEYLQYLQNLPDDDEEEEMNEEELK
jgi:hypothetical protein